MYGIYCLPIIDFPPIPSNGPSHATRYISSRRHKVPARSEILLHPLIPNSPNEHTTRAFRDSSQPPSCHCNNSNAMDLSSVDLCTVPAGKSPDGQYNFKNPKTLGPTIIAIGVVLCTISVILVIGRIHINKRKLGAADCMLKVDDEDQVNVG